MPTVSANASTLEKPAIVSEIARFQTRNTPRTSATTAIGTTASVSLEGMLHCFDADSARVRPASFAPMPKR